MLLDKMRGIAISSLLGLVLFTGTVNGDYTDHPKAEAFIKRMAEEHGFEREYIRNTLASSEYKQSIIDAISRPAEKKFTWERYRKIFLKQRRIDGGKAFLAEHKEIFDRAEAEYGVPREIIAAIIGVETRYGNIKGSYRLIDSLPTLAFDYPPRSKFFAKQLEHVFLLAREQGLDVTELTGSYAGAMGYGQFIPSSYRAYAVDFDGDGVADIWDNVEDAIGSVANYFHVHKWNPGAPVTHSVSLTKTVDEKLINDSLKPKHDAADLRNWGVNLPDSVYGSEPASLVELEGENGQEFWAAWHNFYVITRYNHSRLYAMAVYQLSQTFLD